jgi:hypothetical protein
MWRPRPYIFSPVCDPVPSAKLFSRKSCKFRIGVLDKEFSCRRECPANGMSDIRILLKGIGCFYIPSSHIYYPIWVNFGVRYLHFTLWSICVFCENRFREGRTFLMGANEITFTRLRWNRKDIFIVNKGTVMSVCYVTEHAVWNLFNYRFWICIVFAYFYMTTVRLLTVTALSQSHFFASPSHKSRFLYQNTFLYFGCTWLLIKPRCNVGQFLLLLHKVMTESTEL